MHHLVFNSVCVCSQDATSQLLARELASYAPPGQIDLLLVPDLRSAKQFKVFITPMWV